MGRIVKKKTLPLPLPLPPPTPVFYTGNKKYFQEVYGESQYYRNISRLLPPDFEPSEDWEEFDFFAGIGLDRDNSMPVFISGLIVGYIPAKDVSLYSQLIYQLRSNNQFMCVRAILRAGVFGNGSFGATVRLDI